MEQRKGEKEARVLGTMSLGDTLQRAKRGVNEHLTSRLDLGLAEE